MSNLVPPDPEKLKALHMIIMDVAARHKYWKSADLVSVPPAGLEALYKAIEKVNGD